MSLVTRCPSCATTFKVVRDQLRISDGWVRCGRCSHVFDASLDLQELPEPAVAVPAVPALSALSASAASVPSSSPLSDDADFFDDEPLPEPVASAPAPLQMPGPDFDDDDVDEVDVDEPAESDPSRGPYPPGEVPQEERQPYVVTDGSETVFVRWPMPMPAHELNLSEPAQRTELAPPLQSTVRAGAIVLPRSVPGLPSIGLVADEPWPQVVTPQFGNDDDAPSAKAPLIVPAHFGEQADNASQVQFQKSLRRARDKAAKIARSREKNAAAQDSKPMPLVQSESEVDAKPFATMSVTAERAPVASKGVTLPRLLRAASAPAFWSGAKGRALVGAGVLLGVLLLTVQVLHHEHDAIAARQPGLRPLLAGVCAVTGCQLSALRQIGDVTIDGAAFAREKVGDGYRLSFTLRNAASVPLAMPAIELSLLDTQEQTVVRRVLLPADFGGPAELAARGERVASMLLALDATQAASLPPVAGYRLVAFYP